MVETMNVLSLFDGISCGQLALIRAGFKNFIYYASEIDKNSIKVTQHNFPNTIQLGSVTDVDVNELEKIGLLIGGSPCFAAGTKVITINGYKNIEDIVVGDMVLTHKNRFMSVLKVGNKVADTFTLKAQGFIDVVCTENHPFYARKKCFEYYRQNNGKNSKRMFLGKPEWVKACNLKNNYYVCANIQNDECENHLNINEDEAYVIGRYIADGHTRKDRRFDCKPNGNKGHNGSRAWQLILSIGNSKVEKLCLNIKELHYSCYKHTDSVHRVVFSNKRLVEIVEKYCGIGSMNKHFGEPIINLPKNLLSIVLKGYLDGDGCVRENKWRIATISPILAMSVSRVVSKLYGKHVNIHLHKPEEYKVLMGRVVHQNYQYTIEFSEKTFEHENPKVIDGKIWYGVKSFTNNEKQTVYNLEITEDNSYTANNFVVHNCQSFSFAGKGNGMSTKEKEDVVTLERYLELKSKGCEFEGYSYLFWEYVRILKDIRKYNPDVKFLLENVSMKKKHEEIITNTLGVEPIVINSSLVSAQNRVRLYWTNIPNIEQPEDKGIKLSDIIEFDNDKNPAAIRGRKLFKATIVGRKINSEGKREDYNSNIPTIQCLEVRNSNMDKSNCLTTVDKDNVLTSLNPGRYPDAFKNKLPFRYYTLKECCRLQTVPDNYFGDIVSESKGKKMLGNGWTVDVISHILKNIENEK